MAAASAHVMNAVVDHDHDGLTRFGTVACPDGPGCAASALTTAIAERLLDDLAVPSTGAVVWTHRSCWETKHEPTVQARLQRVDVAAAAQTIEAVAAGTLPLVDRIVGLSDAPSAFDDGAGTWTAAPCKEGVEDDLLLIGAAATVLARDRGSAETVDRTSRVAAAQVLLEARDRNADLATARYGGGRGIDGDRFVVPAGMLVGTTEPHPDPDHRRSRLHQQVFERAPVWVDTYAAAYVEATLRARPCAVHGRVREVVHPIVEGTPDAVAKVAAQTGVCCDTVEDLLVAMVRGGNTTVGDLLAEGDVTPTDALVEVLWDGAASTRRRMVARDDVSADVGQLLDGSASVVAATVKHQTGQLTADQWEQVAGHESPKVRQAAAVYVPDDKLVMVLRTLLDQPVSKRIGKSVRVRVDDAADGVVPADLRVWVWATTGS